MQAILEAAEMKQNGQTKKVIVTGCLAQRYSHNLAGGNRSADPDLAHDATMVYAAVL